MYTREKTVKLIDLANRAKNGEAYLISNVICGVFLSQWFEYATEPPFSIVIETGDSQGYDEREAHYDLVVFNCAGRNLNIPLPLLDVRTVAALLKQRPTFTPRLAHSRETTVISGAEEQALWDDLFEIVGTWEARQGLGYLSNKAELLEIIRFHEERNAHPQRTGVVDTSRRIFPVEEGWEDLPEDYEDLRYSEAAYWNN